MIDFKKVIRDGLAGKNVGIPGGLPRFDKKTYNIQLGKMYSIVSSPKTGKTFFTIWRFILVPWMSGIRNIRWTYFSLEVDEEQIIARITSYFVYAKFNRKVPYYRILGYGDNKMTPEEVKLVDETYDEEVSELLKYLDIIVDSNVSNPTGIYKYCLNMANQEGTFLYEKYNTIEGDINTASETTVEKKKLVGYTPNDSNLKRMVIIDTVGLMKLERNFLKKDNIDKWVSDYAIILRNICKFTIVNVHHLNRNISTTDRKKLLGEDLQPERGDIQDSSSLAQSSDQVIALFNPSDYAHLTAHMGYHFLKFGGKYRSIHVIDNRMGEMPINTAAILDPDAGCFIELPLPNTIEIEELYEMMK